MCGIVGMCFRSTGVGKRGFTANRHRAGFTRMLVAAQERGAAATGVLLISREDKESKPKATVLRAPLPAKDFVETDEYKGLMEKLNASTISIMGHTRAVSDTVATAKNNKNNHPHCAGSIVGVHNGRVLNDKNLWVKYSAYMSPKSKCDSEAIFALINRKLGLGDKGTFTAISRATAELKGWGAVALVNLMEPNKVFLYRDGIESPLTLAWYDNDEMAAYGTHRSYIEDGVRGYQGKITYRKVDPLQVVAIDSESPGKERGDFFVETRRLKTTETLEDRRKMIEEHQEEYNVTQGK